MKGNIMTSRLLALPVAIVLVTLPASAQTPQKAVTAQAFLTERPTLNSLGFEWQISGDDNRNAAVEVSYRVAGEKTWRKALPLFRMNGEKVTGPRPHFGDRNYYTFVAPNMFAGSLLNLAPDTAYEARFVLSDPDGVRGKSEVVVNARTRGKPVAAPRGHRNNV
jgi:hypothetical protein